MRTALVVLALLLSGGCNPFDLNEEQPEPSCGKVFLAWEGDLLVVDSLTGCLSRGG